MTVAGPRPPFSLGVLATQGVASGPPRRVLAEILQQAEAAEGLGFDLFALAEHRRSPHYFGSALSMAFALAARTERIRVGTAVTIAPLHHPIALAQDAAMLDQLSGGRLFLGLGPGYLEADFAAFGADFTRRVAVFEETLEILRPAWSGEVFSHTGPTYRLMDVQVLPTPLQQPPLIHVGAATRPGIARAARMGDAWITDARIALPAMARAAGFYRQAAAVAGRPARVWAVRYCWPTVDRDRGRALFAPACVQMARHMLAEGRLPEAVGRLSDDALFDAFARDRIIFGTPEDCATAVRDLVRAVDVEGLILIFRHPSGPPLPAVVQAMTVFAQDVVPLLAGLAGAADRSGRGETAVDGQDSAGDEGGGIAQ